MSEKRETCHEVADREIARYRHSLKHNPKANTAVCRQKIDDWLDYRLQHSPKDLKAKL